MHIFYKPYLIASSILLLTPATTTITNAFTIIPTTKTTTTTTTKSITTSFSKLKHQAISDGTELKVNGESTSSSSSSSSISTNDKIESIRQQAISQYEEAMEYYMFELGNDIVFLSNHNEVSNYISTRFDTIIFDCDGVLYRGGGGGGEGGGNGNTPIPQSSEALRYLVQEQQKQILFLTNNAEYSREELCTKLCTIFDCEEGEGLLKKEQMITSSYSTAKYLESKLLKETTRVEESGSSGNVVVIGSNGLCNEIEKFGFQVKSLTNLLNSNNNSNNNNNNHNDDDDDDDNNHGVEYAMDRAALATFSFEDIETFPNNDHSNIVIDAIVIGLDTSFTYRKLCIVSALIQRHPNALFIATNEDAFDVVDGLSSNHNDKRNLPGNGSIVKSIEMTCQKKAINVGKPSKVLVDLLQKEFQFDYDRTLMVGDRLDTDVKFGKDGGMKSALVLTGCTTVEKLKEVGVGTEEEPLPHIMIPHMGMMYGNYYE